MSSTHAQSAREYVESGIDVSTLTYDMLKRIAPIRAMLTLEEVGVICKWICSAPTYHEYIHRGSLMFGMQTLLHYRQGRRTSRMNGSQWQRVRRRVFSRDDYTCSYCGKRGGRLECDHVVPVSRGGSSDISNLITACVSCNRAKGAKTLVEWLNE